MLCYLTHKPEWRNGRRARLKIWYSLSVWVQVPPPVPFTEITHLSTGCVFFALSIEFDGCGMARAKSCRWVMLGNLMAAVVCMLRGRDA